MAIQLGLTRNENEEDHILIHLETEDLLRLERIFKGMSHCLVEYTIPEILSLDKSQKFDLKLQNNNENIGLKQTRTDYFEWKQRRQTGYHPDRKKIRSTWIQNLCYTGNCKSPQRKRNQSYPYK